MQTKILFFASIKDMTGVSFCNIQTDPTMRAQDIYKLILEQYPCLDSIIQSCMLAQNYTYVSDLIHVHPQDEFALIPPVSGG